MNSKETLEILNILSSILGSYDVENKKGEYSFFCPFCSHRKKKLQVNIESGKWHCWVCDAKGQKIKNLLKRLDVDRKSLQRIYEIYKDSWVTTSSEEDNSIQLFLPKEFKPLWKKPKGINPKFRKAYHYITKKRNLTEDDIRKYNIGYCEDGVYADMIIIPSYDSTGKLNYFISRSFYNNRYKNPPVSRNTIIFENQINWKLPITIVEGGFDAITTKKNSTPLLSKFISKKLFEAIFEKGVKDIIIMMDEDAQDQALYYANYFSNQGISTKNIVLKGKDPNEVGFDEVSKTIKRSEVMSYSDLIKQKLDLL